MPPGPPVVELKEVNGNTFSLVWTPGPEGDSPITGFILEYKAVNGKSSFLLQHELSLLTVLSPHTASWDLTKTVKFGPDQTDATILEMNPSTYNVRMFAKDSLGMSTASNVLTITTSKTGAQNCFF